MENININSGQVQVIGEHSSIYLYTHDGATTLVSTVHDVLSRRTRWDDPDYLARMLFCAMVPPDKWDGQDGFGIGTQYYIDTNLLMVIDTVKKTIAISSFGAGVDDIVMNLEDFVQNFYNSAEL